MQNYAIWAIALGAVILLFEAYKEYTTADAVDNLKSNNQTSRKELENVRMSALTTRSEHRRGLLIYMIFFIGFYAVLLLSPELVTAFIAGSGQAETVSGGASTIARSIVNRGEDGAAQGALTNSTALPFWLAMSITLGATSPTFQVIERKIRAIAYFFAGVPRNIFRVLQSLEELNYGHFGEDAQMPLLQAFCERLEAHPANPILRGTVQSIESSLRCIDLLQAPIIGPQRSAFRQLFNDDAPLARIDDLRARYNQLANKISELHSDDEALQELQDEAVTLADAMQCLFALYAIRSRRIPEALRDTPTAEIIEKVAGESTAQSLHDITLASIFGAVFSYVLVEKYALVASGVGAFDEAEEVRVVAAAMLIPLLPALVLLAFLTILFRHLRIDQGAWPRPETAQIPFWDYAKLAFWPALCASVLYGLVTCLCADGVARHILAGEGSKAVGAGLAFLATEVEQLPRIFLMSYVCACGLLFLADQHDRLRWFVTLGVALVLSAFLWMVANLAASLFGIAPPGLVTRADMTIMVTLPFSIFLLLYASAAEFAETESMKRVFTAVGQPFRGRQT